MTSIDWTKLIDWITQGLIGVIFGAISMYIAHVVNKKWEQKKEQKRKELEAKSKWLMPNGLPPANVTEAIKQAEKEGHKPVVLRKSPITPILLMLLVAIGTGVVTLVSTTYKYIAYNPTHQTQIAVTAVVNISSPTPSYAYPDYASILCPIPIKQETLDLWKTENADVPTVQALINEFNKERINDSGAFDRGSRIPARVAIVINFDVTDGNIWSQYPVIAIAHYGSWGIFETTGDFISPSAGACRLIVP